jgi:hypothetical protein
MPQFFELDSRLCNRGKKVKRFRELSSISKTHIKNYVLAERTRHLREETTEVGRVKKKYYFMRAMNESLMPTLLSLLLYN